MSLTLTISKVIRNPNHQILATFLLSVQAAPDFELVQEKPASCSILDFAFGRHSPISQLSLQAFELFLPGMRSLVTAQRSGWHGVKPHVDVVAVWRVFQNLLDALKVPQPRTPTTKTREVCGCSAIGLGPAATISCRFVEGSVSRTT